MTARRDMTEKEFEMALRNQGFKHVHSLMGFPYYESTKPGTSASIHYPGTFHPTDLKLMRRATIRDLISSRKRHEKKYPEGKKIKA